MEKSLNSTVDNDLGLTQRTSVAVRSNLGRMETLRMSNDVQEEANRLMTTSAPETMVQRVLDVLAPSDVRRERRRGEKEVIRAEVDKRVAIHQTISSAHTREIQIQADAYITARELSAVKETGMFAIQVETEIETDIIRSGADFDKEIDGMVRGALTLESQSARESAADRIERLKLMRGEVERVIMGNVANAIRSPRERG
jgi:hypothetical protein